MINSYLSERVGKKRKFFDEVSDADGNVYPHWKEVLRQFGEMGDESLKERAEDVSRILRENGVTHNVYGDPDGLNRAWQLDPIPMVFSEQDWSFIDQGLKQRAKLLDIVLKDIYGSRKLIRSGDIPFELIYNHKGFLRQLDKLRLPGDQLLIQYSADLARGPNGKMWVLNDRTDAPSGAGYSFENRSVMMQAFPDMIRNNKIQRINEYYNAVKRALMRLSWQDKLNPRIVILTPGPGNETFFEHAYLSSLMGFTLVTGDDLMVSDGYVWLKTIGGLEKVDVIVRRVDDIFCDPMEFNMDSRLGVVGLMEAIRDKKVTVINPLGCRVLENPGLMAFLPKLSQKILGEDLLLPSVATWWCGQKKELDYVLDNIQNLVIKRIYIDSQAKSIWGAQLGEKEILELKEAILLEPYMYVGQEMATFSTTPSYIDGEIQPKSAVFRGYAIADGSEDGYTIMRGGLSRSSKNEGLLMPSANAQSISKDTWVIGDDSTKQTKSIQEKVHYGDWILPSKTAENLFWLGRYGERSIHTIRLLRTVLKRRTESPDIVHPEKDDVLVALLQSLTAMTLTQPGFEEEDTLKSPDEELLSLIKDTAKIGSLAQSIQAFLNNSYSVRDKLGLDIWRILDMINDSSVRYKQIDDLRVMTSKLDNSLVRLMGFHGMMVDTMTRDDAWHIYSIGRFLESSINICVILKEVLKKDYPIEVERELLEKILMVNESLITYRYHYKSAIEISSVISLLLINETNPRSLTYHLEHIQKELGRLPSKHTQYLSSIQKKLLKASMMVRLCEPDQLVLVDKEGSEKRVNLINFFTELVQILASVSTDISSQYFSHTTFHAHSNSTLIPEI
ncbi:circularly permuted type 2 ATP-grasp protein [Reichenbachiella versicolor]|uniref:circularly permuted type 2 ATP-grasp protein n=1 Tax=Reichenbachiella versicolor TaxID=1821036 RepID=UPI000D6E40A9|nr:circularly permuted type 2 ATP-grasp protein [Reichenbachiella versicolor]